MTKHQRFTPVIIAYLIIGTISIIGSSFVTATLVRFGMLKTSITRLLLLLHVSLLVEEFTIIPYIYDYNLSVCTMMEFFHFYSGLMNVMVILLLVISYRYLFFEDTWKLNWYIKRFDVAIVTLFPLITLLAFSAKIYSKDNGDFCTPSIQHEESNIWSISVFYVWVWLAEFAASAVLFRTMYSVYRADKTMGYKMLSTIGLYNIIAVVCWIPRTMFRIAQLGQPASSNKDAIVLASYMPVYLSGILYTLVFLRERQALAVFIRYHEDQDTTTDSLHSVDGLSFSWENEEASHGAFNNHGGPEPRHSAAIALRQSLARSTLSSVVNSRVESRSNSSLEMAHPVDVPDGGRVLSSNSVNSGSSNSRTSSRAMPTSVILQQQLQQEQHAHDNDVATVASVNPMIIEAADKAPVDSTAHNLAPDREKENDDGDGDAEAPPV